MSIDKAEWHYEGTWPEGLPHKHANVHIGLFLGWILDANMQSTEMDEHFGHLIDQFRRRNITGPQLIDVMNGSLVEEDLNGEAEAFANDFYTDYLDQFATIIDAGESHYEAEDTWENLEKIKTFLDEHFQEWRKTSKYREEPFGTVDLESLLSLMAQKSGHAVDECRATYMHMLEVMAHALSNKSRVTLEGFGTFDTYSVDTAAIEMKDGSGSVPAHVGKHIRFSAAVPFKKLVDRSLES